MRIGISYLLIPTLIVLMFWTGLCLWGNLVAFDTSEDCLSESEYPTAPPRETRNKKGGPLRDRPFDFGARDP